MRKGRYAQLSESGIVDGAKPSLPEIFLFDLVATTDHHGERVAIERVRMLKFSAPLMAAVHMLAGGALAWAALESAAASVFAILLPIAGALILDLAFSYLLRRRNTVGRRPYAVTRATAAYIVVAGAIWCLLAGPASALSDHAGSWLLPVAIGSAFAAAIVAFMASPPLLALNLLAALAAAAATGAGPFALLMLTLAGGCLLSFSLYTARDMMLAAQRRFAAEWHAEKARRFVAEFEQRGGGWFWETTADGALSYVSEQLAEDLGQTARDLVGSQFTDLLSVGHNQDSDLADRTLGFHLSARFPFSDVTVKANAVEDIWWSLSGSPIFDEYGRFLGFRGIGTDLTEQKRSEAEISRLARYDSLTGLPNRNMMRKLLEDALPNAHTRKKGASLFLIDLDRFKNVNDTLGHPVGDALLRQVAQRLTSVLGKEGQVGRQGGDEFEAVLPGIDDEAHLSAIAERLIQQVAMPYMIDGANISIGASVGIAIARPGQACADLLIRDADLALYAAKAAGRGTHCFFRPEMHSEAQDRQMLENDLRHALGRGELKLLYQPSVNTVTEEVVGFEALARWTHPVKGAISPADFIPLAEECGLITQIGEWVLRTACATAASWPANTIIAVNLSPIQFTNPSLPATVLSALAESGLEPWRLELEITEGVFLVDSAATDEMFGKLKAIGVRLSLDDFGTGYSSLGYLRKAPFDKIKIDQSFVRGAANKGSRNAAIIKAIVSLAESLGMDTTAEGAETYEELTLIRELGCSQVQGYIFGKPMPADEAHAYAAEKGTASATSSRYRAPRHSLIRRATLDWDEGELSVRIRNISAGGAMIESDRGFPPGTRISLDIVGHGVLDAEVRWTGEGRVGVRFDQEFDIKLLTAATLGGATNVKMLRPHYLSAPVAEEPKKRFTSADLGRR